MHALKGVFSEDDLIKREAGGLRVLEKTTAAAAAAVGASAAGARSIPTIVPHDLEGEEEQIAKQERVERQLLMLEEEGQSKRSWTFYSAMPGWQSSAPVFVSPHEQKS